MAEPRAQPRYWMVTASGADRQYAGNTGYADDLESSYRYDQNVANHRQISVGDLLLIRDEERLLGISRIQRLEHKFGPKILRRCPTCHITALKPRKKLSPRYRCNNKHEFDRPDEEEVELELFEAKYKDTFRRGDVNVLVSELRNACPRYGAQLSMQELMPDLLPPIWRPPSARF